MGPGRTVEVVNYDEEAKRSGRKKMICRFESREESPGKEGEGKRGEQPCRCAASAFKSTGYRLDKAKIVTYGESRVTLGRRMLDKVLFILLEILAPVNQVSDERHTVFIDRTNPLDRQSQSLR